MYLMGCVKFGHMFIECSHMGWCGGQFSFEMGSYCEESAPLSVAFINLILFTDRRGL